MSRKNLAILKFIVLGLIIIGIPLYLVVFHWDFLVSMTDSENVEVFFKKYKSESVFIYIGVQIIQIIISIIPGQQLQFVAGYLYGYGFAFLYSVIGAFIGTTISFYLARLLGKDSLHVLFGKSKVEKHLDSLNSSKGIVLIFIFYLIPGFPKDMISYVGGLSKIKYKIFITVSLIARSPAMIGSIALGNLIKQGNYTLSIIIVVFAIIVFTIGFFKRKKIYAFIDRLKEIEEEHDKGNKDE